MLNELELTGRARTHVVQRDDLGGALHADAIEPYLAMKADAARAGIDLALASAFRDFEAQQRIWNLKWTGERPLYDAEGEPREHATLTPEALLEAILCWSALPGGSRHHWGSEIDVFDRAAMPEGYRLRLLPGETEPGGVFYALHCWLDTHLSRYGFFRPYSTFRGGVRPEAWHLSYAPVALPALERLTPDVLSRAVSASEMLGKEVVLGRIGELHKRFIASVDAPDAAGRGIV